MDRVNPTAFVSGIMIGIGNVVCISVDNKYVGATEIMWKNYVK